MRSATTGGRSARRVLAMLLVALASPLLEWATSSGAYVNAALAVEEDAASGSRGLIVTRDVAEDAVLLTLPAELQLGVDAATRDPATRKMLDATPPALWSARLGLALCAEKQSDSSRFSPYLNTLPSTLDCCLAPGYAEDERSAALTAWPPTAARATDMRRALRSLHAKLTRVASDDASDAHSGDGTTAAAPTFEELAWATSIVGSRAYRVRGGPGEKVEDAARLLPIADMVNYALPEAANAQLRNAPKRGGTIGAPETTDDPYAVSLYACRPMKAGDEVLVDYGFGKHLSNERLLLEYGFVLPLDVHQRETCELPFGAIAVGLAAVQAAATAEEEQPLSNDLVDALGRRQQALLSQLGDVEAAGLAFDAEGTPTEPTLALALVLTAQEPAELAPSTVAELVAEASGAGAQSGLTARARLALRAVAAEALGHLDAALAEDAAAEDAGFEAVAHAYCLSRRQVLAQACEVLGD